MAHLLRFARFAALFLMLTGFATILAGHFEPGRSLCVLGLAAGLPSVLLPSRRPGRRS